MRFSCLHTKQLDSNINQLTRRGFRIPRSGTHKKGKTICYGLLLALLTIAGLSLNLPSDVSALKHEINTIPIAGYSNLLSSYRILWSPDNTPSSFDSVKSPRLFHSRLNSSNKCSYLSNAWDYSFSYPDIGFYSYIPNSPIGNNNDILCSQLSPFGSNSIPEFESSSLPAYTFGTPDFRSMLPYWYDYDAYTLYESRTDTESGLSYNYRFKFSDIYGFAPNKPRQIVIPLGVGNSSKIGNITQGRDFTISGVFDFSGSGNTFEWSPDINQYGVFRLYVRGFSTDDPSNISVQDTYNCSVNLRTLAFNDFIQLEYSCSGTFSHNLSDVGFSLEFLNTKSGSDVYLWDTNADYTFSTAYLITDHDDTPGAPLSDPVTGGNLQNSPAGLFFSSVMNQDTDFISTLSNLFNFSFINPFAPIFHLFTDQNSCSSIPTIASMIHSEETTVCPWFDSTTRNIVTPVLGLASMMLVFGFTVRWLGSRSGNFIEDSEGIDSGGYHFGNKYRRSK